MTAQSQGIMTVEQWWSLGMGLGLNMQTDSVYLAVLLGQADLETGGFRSRVYMEANNMFGMRPAERRPQNRVGIMDTANGKFAIFQTLNESLRDRIAWDSYNNIERPMTWDDASVYMAKVMKKGYTHETNYISVWKERVAKYVGAYDLDSPDMMTVEDMDDDGSGLFNGTGGLGLVDGINKVKMRYGILGIIVLAVLGYWLYRRFKNR